MEYTIQEAAKALQVTDRTVRKWLHALQIKSTVSSKDKRSRVITDEELFRLSDYGGRTLALDAPRLSLERLAERVYVLEQDLHGLRQTVRQLENPLALILGENSTTIASEANGLQDIPIERVYANVQAAIDLVDSAPQLLTPLSKTLYVTFFGKADVFELVPLLRHRWMIALQKAISRGWVIAHLIRRTDELYKCMSVVGDVIQLLGTKGGGTYKPVLVSVPLRPDEQAEYVAVPGRGAIEMRSSNGKQYVDKALRYPIGRELDVMLTNIDGLFRQGIALAQSFQPQSVAFSGAVAAIDGLPGDHCLVMNGLSDLTIPMQINQERAAKLPTDQVDIVRKRDGILRARSQRLESFERLVPDWNFRDICPMTAIQKYVEETGIYTPTDTMSAIGAPPLTRSQRKRHIEYLVDRLRHVRHYELGLVDEHTNVHRSIFQTFWLVKPGNGVLIECLKESDRGVQSELDFQIRELPIVDAFQEFFYSYLWNRLDRVNKDKGHVIQWLESLVRNLPDDDS